MAVTNITNVGSLSDDRTVKCNEDHPNVMENVMEAPPVGSLSDDRAENVMEKCNEDHPKRLIRCPMWYGGVARRYIRRRRGPWVARARSLTESQATFPDETSCATFLFERRMILAFDLALYTAKDSRSRPLDRYARAARLVPGSDESRMLEAMRDARFSIWRIEQRHKTAGLIVTDVLREAEEWLIDERLEESASEGMAFAGGLSKPEGFAMTCGTVVPVDRDMIEEVIFDTLAWRRGNPEQVAQDPRFAIAIYRAAIDSGMMGGVTYE